MKTNPIASILNFMFFISLALISLDYIELAEFNPLTINAFHFIWVPIHDKYPYFISEFYGLTCLLKGIQTFKSGSFLFPSSFKTTLFLWAKILGLFLCLIEFFWIYQIPRNWIIFLHPISVICYFILIRSFFHSSLLTDKNGASIKKENRHKNGADLDSELEDLKIKTASKKIENEASFHWKTKHGYINITNPFQGIMIVGGAGSGKTYTVIQEIIMQAIQKGYTGFIYDYKYPELSEFVYQILKKKPGHSVKFYSVNFTHPSRSHRLNPIHPRNLPISLFAQEFSAILLKNLKREWVDKQDFWADNAIAYFKSIIWFLKKYEPDFCTIPHAITFAMKEYPWVLEILSKDRECKGMISSLWTAYQENASAQIAGCVSSLQNPLDRLNNPSIFWILSGDDISLNLNDPENPGLLCIGNHPILADALNPIISLVASVVMKNLNQRGKIKSIFLLDEAPTLYIPNLKDLPNTGRSNLISTIYCCQDFSQMDLMYGDREAKVIRASLGNQFLGMVNDLDTSHQISKVFGKEDQIIQSKNHSTSYSANEESNQSAGYSFQLQEKEILKPNAALNFPPGFFVGKVTAAKHPFFSGKPIIIPREPTKQIPDFSFISTSSKLSHPLKGSETVFETIKNPMKPLPEIDNSIPIAFESRIAWNYEKIQMDIDNLVNRHIQ